MTTATTTDLAERGRLGQLVVMLEKMEKTIWSALGVADDEAGHRLARRFMRAVVNAVRQNPDLLECTPDSLMQAAIRAAEWNLIPGTAMALAHIVPFRKQAVLIPDYKGLIDLALRQGVARKIESRPVFSNDVFNCVYGDHPSLEHVPAPLDKPRGEMIGVYCVAWLTTGETIFDVMRLDEIELIRARSPGRRANKPTPWDTDFVEMGRKTVVKRAMKYLPKTPLLSAAVAADDYAERGEAPPEELELEEIAAGKFALPSPLPGPLEEMKEKLRAGAKPDGKEARPEPAAEPPASEPPAEVVRLLSEEETFAHAEEPGLMAVAAVDRADGSWFVFQHQTDPKTLWCSCREFNRTGECEHTPRVLALLMARGDL